MKVEWTGFSRLFTAAGSRARRQNLPDLCKDGYYFTMQKSGELKGGEENLKSGL